MWLSCQVCTAANLENWIRVNNRIGLWSLHDFVCVWVPHFHFLQECFKNASQILQRYLKDTFRLLQGWFNDVSRVFQGYFKVVSRMLQSLFKDVPRILQVGFNDTSISYENLYPYLNFEYKNFSAQYKEAEILIPRFSNQESKC